MTGVTHVLVGSGLAVLLTGNTSLAGLAAAAVGSLAPDLDSPRSFLGKRLVFISMPLSAAFGHRSLTHSLLGALLLTIPVYIYYPDLVVSWLIGYISHILLDIFNYSGVRLFWPLPLRLSMNLIKTGSMVEYGIMFISILFAADFWQKMMDKFF